jgi:hypothetical protein
VLAEAISAAKELKLEEERSAIEMTATVKADSERMLRDAEIIKREYEEMVDSFNAMLEQNASELEITAARFAEFVKNRRIDTAETQLDGNAFYKSVGALNDAALPDASENPALLMQNIYRIQNRPLPEDRLEAGTTEKQAAAEFEPQSEPGARGTGAVGAKQLEVALTGVQPDEALLREKEESISMGAQQSAKEEPFSEAAWMNEAQQSESEPQAEFTKAFDDAFIKSDYNIHMDDCNVTQADAASAIDALLSGQDAGGTVTAERIPEASALVDTTRDVQPESDAVRAFDEYFIETFAPSGDAAQDDLLSVRADGLPKTSQQAAIAPEPYSEQAWAQSEIASAFEPQAEGVLFGDIAVETAVTAQTEATIEQQPSGEAEIAFDEYLAQIITDTPAATGPATETAAEVTAQQAAITPEPYSEQAWAQSEIASAFEPQAEGVLFSAVEPEEEPEPAPAPRRYNEYGEIREWEPEPEPDLEDMPTVSRYVGKSGNYDEISLDDLLDEIIKSGE